jgi:single-stranded-DNA-specific exonuclease
VLHAPEWHEGVIGIVASRVVEHTYKPTLILTRSEGGLFKGSGRSIPEFDLFAGLGRCADVLAGYGGHRQAAGLRVEEGRLEELRERFHEAAREQLGDEPLTPGLKLDAELGFSQIDFTLLKELEMLQPFGMGNPEPVFVSPTLELVGRREFGRDKAHVALELKDPAAGVTLRAKAWRQAKELPPGLKGKSLRIAYTPRIDRYNGLASIDLRLRDWQLVDDDADPSASN